MQKKRLIGREVLLAYPDFNALFEIHTDASKLQNGAVISPKGQTNCFLFTKDEHHPKKYTTTDKELLYVVASLKESCNILLGQ